MPTIIEKNILGLMSQHLHNIYVYMSSKDRSIAAETLGLLCGCEDFSTHKDEFIHEDSQKEAFKALKGDFIGTLIEDDMDMRRKVRPYLDYHTRI